MAQNGLKDLVSGTGCAVDGAAAARNPLGKLIDSMVMQPGMNRMGGQVMAPPRPMGPSATEEAFRRGMSGMPLPYNGPSLMNQQNSEFANAFMKEFEGPKAEPGGRSGWADEFASQSRGIRLKPPSSVIQAGAMQARGVPQVMRAPVMQPVRISPYFFINIYRSNDKSLFQNAQPLSYAGTEDDDAATDDAAADESNDGTSTTIKSDESATTAATKYAKCVETSPVQSSYGNSLGQSSC